MFTNPYTGKPLPTDKYLLTNLNIGQSPHQTLNIATVGKLLLLLLLLKNYILDNSLLASLQAGHPAM